MGVYPFMFGALKDFEPIVDELIGVRYHNVERHVSRLLILFDC